MRRNFRKRLINYTLMFFASLGVLLADQMSKGYVYEALIKDTHIEVSSFCNIILVWNYGMSFGIFNDADQNQGLLITCAIIIVMTLMYYTRSASKKLSYISAGLIIGGAFGNIMDRIYYGAVLDFIDIYYAKWHYPTFNVADCMICLGVFILLFVTKEP